MRKLFILIALLTFSFVLNVNAQEKLPIDPQVRYGKLSNGLTYYIRQNAYPEKRADFYIAQKVGSMQEEDSQMGLAHFLEHMAFNGSKNFPGRKAMLDYLEKNGAKFGANVNAYTSFDETVYNLSDIPVVREGVVDSCLLILHDWSGFITLDNEEIDKERSIIKEEWRTRGSAQMRIWEKQLPILFKDSKYANRLPIGTMEVVENFEHQTLKDYYHKWYRPDLQAIIVVGDIDADKVEAKIKAMFADIPAPANPAERIYYPVPDNEEPIVAITTDPEAVRTQVTLYIKHDVLPAELKKTNIGLIMSVMQELVSKMFSDRLSEISQKADAPFAVSIAYDGPYFVSKTKDAWTTIALSKEGQIDATLATLIRENERVSKFGFTDAELERAKATLLQRYETAYNNRSKELNDSYIREYVESFTDGDAIPGIEFEYNFVKQFAPMVDADAINQFIRQIITDKNIVISVTGPEKDGIIYPSESELLNIFKIVDAENMTPYAETVSNEPLISQLPKAGSIVDTKTDEKLGSTSWTLSNGMRVVLKKTDFKDDEILMSSIAYGGTSIVPDNDMHNAELVGAVPHIGGIGNFSATDLKKVLAGKSAKVGVNVGRWDQNISGSSNIKDVETLLQLTYLYFTAPRKDLDAYTSLLDMIKNQLKNMKTEPSAIFSDSTTYAMYGDNLRTKELKLEDAEKLNYDRTIEIYKEVFANPGSFVFTFVGNVDEVAMKPLVEQYLASLPSGNKNARYKDVNYDIRKGTYTNVFEQEMKNPKASVFDLYSGTLKRDQKTRIALDALNQVLDMVYVETIREEEGGTYGVRSRVEINRIPEGQTIVQMTYDTDPEKAATLNKIIHRELDKIAQDGPKDKDFQKVKEYMAKKFQENTKQNGYWNAVLNAYYFYNDDVYSNYMTILNSLTTEDVKAVTKALLSQENVIEVIMVPKK
ncbi:pitrilysin family protein [Dysgonomonas sp. ZJ709]|uniref:M16 family metallopeptidase n=1 Tax=Dysgonomonas sp. ZJ709 TaxID=2709797 RepID=UPI0013ED5BE3|nr:insulinase family protein [Dysgonomonas sp. ZJ709]